MRMLATLLKEAVALFVDDGTLAATVLVWIAVCGSLFRLVPAGAWQGPILFIGLAAILIENVRRASAGG